MSWTHVNRPWPGEPGTCTCTRTTAADLDGTLGCPAGWYQDQDGTWVHVTDPRTARRARKAAQAAT